MFRQSVLLWFTYPIEHLQHLGIRLQGGSFSGCQFGVNIVIACPGIRARTKDPTKINVLPPIHILHLAHFHGHHLLRQDPVHPRRWHARQHLPSNTLSHSSHTRTPTIALPTEPHSADVRVRSDVMHVHCETLNIDCGLADEFDREGAGEPVEVGFTPRVDDE
jgi:hypothetical protein